MDFNDCPLCSIDEKRIAFFCSFHAVTLAPGMT
jgi:hypothetical protein